MESSLLHRLFQNKNKIQHAQKTNLEKTSKLPLGVNRKQEKSKQEVTIQDKNKIGYTQETSKLPLSVNDKKSKWGNRMRGLASKLGFAKHDNNDNQSWTGDSNVPLFGLDLTVRCDLENRIVPNIVTRC